MKTSDITILTLAIIHIVLAIANRNNTLNAVILASTALLIIVYVIITIVSRNRLERNYKVLGVTHEELIDECNQLEIDLANQVKATDECNRLLANQAEKNTLEKAGQIKVKVPPYTNELESIPFTEPIKQCECGANMRETKCYWICDICKKRIRKEK